MYKKEKDRRVSSKTGKADDVLKYIELDYETAQDRWDGVDAEEIMKSNIKRMYFHRLMTIPLPSPFFLFFFFGFVFGEFY